MHKKDFELIASILKTYNESVKNGWAYEMENAFTDMLAEKYPKFQKDKFLRACGVEVKNTKCEHNFVNKFKGDITCKECGADIPLSKAKNYE